MQILSSEFKLYSRQITTKSDLGIENYTSSNDANVLLSKSSCRVHLRQLAEKLTLAFQHTSKTKSILVVVLTKNYIKNTISLLSSMEQSKDSFDLLFVDDHSTDGTPEYLQRKGYAVINNKSGQGLTAFWNIGFRCVT